MPKNRYRYSPPPRYEPVEHFLCRINPNLLVYSSRLKYIAKCQICGGIIPKEYRIFIIADRTHNPDLGLYTHLYTICSDKCMDIFLVAGDVRYMSDYVLNQNSTTPSKVQRYSVGTSFALSKTPHPEYHEC